MRTDQVLLRRRDTQECAPILGTNERQPRCASRSKGTGAEPFGHARLWLQMLRDWKQGEALRDRRMNGPNFVTEAAT